MLDAKSRSTGLIGVKAATSFGCSLARYMQSHTVNTIQYMVPKFNAVIIAVIFSPNCNKLFRTVGLKNDPVEIHCRVNSCDCAITYLYYFIFCWVKEKGKPPAPPPAFRGGGSVSRPHPTEFLLGVYITHVCKTSS